MIAKKGEGTFSEVLEAQSIKNNKQVAIKIMKANFYNIEKVSDSNFHFALGKQPEGDPGSEETVATP